MASPAEALQRAVFATLRASADMATAFGTAPRVFDAVPAPDPNEAEAAYRKRVPMPYVTIGEDDIADDSTTCERAWTATVTVHVWSRAVGKPEAKRIGGAVETALVTEIDIDGFVCIDATFAGARYFTDPDGVTTHGVIEIEYLIDPA